MRIETWNGFGDMEWDLGDGKKARRNLAERKRQVYADSTGYLLDSATAGMHDRVIDVQDKLIGRILSSSSSFKRDKGVRRSIRRWNRMAKGPVVEPTPEYRKYITSLIIAYENENPLLPLIETNDKSISADRRVYSAAAELLRLTNEISGNVIGMRIDNYPYEIPLIESRYPFSNEPIKGGLAMVQLPGWFRDIDDKRLEGIEFVNPAADRKVDPRIDALHTILNSFGVTSEIQPRIPLGGLPIFPKSADEIVSILYTEKEVPAEMKKEIRVPTLHDGCEIIYRFQREAKFPDISIGFRAPYYPDAIESSQWLGHIR